MASVNKVILVGNLGKDPEVRYSQGGDAMCNFSLATTESWKDKASGERKELTEWHRVSFFGKLAEIAGQYLKKGSQVYIEGSLRTRKWTDKEGNERYTTEVRGDELKMLGARPQGQGDSGASDYPSQLDSQGAPPAHKHKPSFDDLGDDIPFAPRAARGHLSHVL